MRNTLLTMLLVLGTLGTAHPARAYIGSFPTLGKMVSDAPHVVTYKVDKVNRNKQVIFFAKVADLKGKDAPAVAKHKLTDAFHPRQARTILDWAEPGALAVSFQSDAVCVVCIGRFWYQCAADSDDWWTMTTGRQELSYPYSGSTAKLAEHVKAMLDGKEPVVTALKERMFGFPPRQGQRGDRKWEQWDTIEAVGARRLMRGKDWPVWRIKA